MILFTYRELKRAWEQSTTAFNASKDKTNAHRLLLFYAVETGLKAVFLNREKKSCDTEGKFSDFLHDLNKIMTHLKVGAQLHLPSNICLDEIKQPAQQRNAQCGELNQVWRYGSKAKTPSDEELEEKLLAINEWIRGELK